MKNFRRWLLNGLAATSLLACLISAAFLVRSEVVSDAVMAWRYNWKLHQRVITYIGCIEGRVVFDRDVFAYSPPYDFENVRSTLGMVQNSTEYRRTPAVRAKTATAAAKWLYIGRNRQAVNSASTQDETLIVVHASFLLLATAILPTIRIGGYIREKRQRMIGHCRNCGYDLRATPDRCPECGKLAEKVI
jgi:hypothetical protein